MRRAALATATALAALLAGWWWWSGRDEAQVPATFERLAAEVADGDADGVLACLHPAYDWRRQWPEVYAREAELRPLLRGDDADLSSPRGLARAGLRQVFAWHALNRLALTWRVERWTPRPDGGVDAVATLGLDAPDGTPVAIRPALAGLRFHLDRHGLSRRLRIVAHDPLPVAVPAP